MRTHGARNAASCRVRCRDVAAICDVSSTASLIGAEEIRADDLALILCDESLMPWSPPESESFVSGHVYRKGIGFTRPYRWFENGPDRVGVIRASRSNVHGVLSQCAVCRVNEKTCSFVTARLLHPVRFVKLVAYAVHHS